MPVYTYKGLSSAGKPVDGILDAESPRGARQRLKQMGVFPTEVMEEPAASMTGASRWLLQRRISVKNLAAISRQLATLVGAGLPLADCLKAISEQVESEFLRRTFSQVRENVVQGSSLADAMAQHPLVFSSLYVNMVRAGEASGALDIVLGRLASYAENQARLINRLRAALTYPIAMAVIGGSILFFLIAYVVPRITRMFQETHSQLPLPTVILIGLSRFLADYWWLIVILLCLLVLLARRALASDAGRTRFDTLLIRLPFFGSLVKKVMIARFARTLATLLASGIPLLDALSIVRNVVGNRVLASAVDNARQAISEGQSIAPPLGNSGVFPPMVLHMIAVGERSGELEAMLSKAADTYDDEVETAANSITAIMEPLMVVIMGGIVLFIVLAILMPIFELNRLVR